MNQDKRLIIFIATAVVLIIGGVVLALTIDFEGTNQGEALLFADHKSFDFGTVSMAKGNVSHTFEIKNNGKDNLKINNIITSCMCTSAVLEKNGRRSPSFGMPGHGSNGSLFWSEELAPDEKANLIVTFDPTAHGPAGVGLIDREITVFSNDPAGRTNFRITANVVP